MAPVRIFLVDDHQMVRDALTARLALAADLWVVGGAATGDPGLAQQVGQLRPAVITVEVDQVGAGTGALLDRLAVAAPAARVVALTASHDDARAVDAARAGALAWVPKESSIDHLIDVLRGASVGRASYPGAQLGEVLRELRADVRRARERSGPLDALSDREREVLTSMVEGRRRAEIARELCVSDNTVRTHTRNILTKLGVRSSLEAVSIALAAGMRPGDHRDSRVVALVRPRDNRSGRR